MSSIADARKIAAMRAMAGKEFEDPEALAQMTARATGTKVPLSERPIGEQVEQELEAAPPEPREGPGAYSGELSQRIPTPETQHEAKKGYLRAVATELATEAALGGVGKAASGLTSLLKASVPLVGKFKAALSPTEKAQLGAPKGTYPYISEEDWPKLRDQIVSRKQKSKTYKTTETFGPLDPELTAYTPGETLALLKHPTVKKWRDEVSQFKVPEEYKTVVLVPCAASKPWGPDACGGHYYPAYNRIRKEVEEGKLPGPVYFATVSEPLGIVPQELWDSFPAYDNPGLFKSDSQRTGMSTQQWNKSEFGQRRMIPFDEEAKKTVIEDLGNTVGDFIENNQSEGREFISFIHAKGMKPSTHSMMLDAAEKARGKTLVPKENRYGKTADDAPRPHKDTTYEWLKAKLLQPERSRD